MPTTADRKNLERKKVAEGIETFSTHGERKGASQILEGKKLRACRKGSHPSAGAWGKQTQILTMQSGQEGKTSQEVQQWENLLEVLQAAPIHNMVAKQAELLEIMEKLEGYCPEGTLQYWLLEHMYETLGTR